MRITREWLDANAPCADGGGWGALEVGADGLELENCWDRFSRADWLLWLLYRSGTLTLPALVEAARDAVQSRLTFKLAVGHVCRASDDPLMAATIAADCFGIAHGANLLGRSVEAYEYMAAGYLCRLFDRNRSPDQIVHAAQAAVCQLVVSKPGAYPLEIHRAVIAELKKKYLEAVGGRRI